MAATTKRLGGNARFSAMLCNILIAKRLSKNEWVLRSCFSFSRCETCLIELRYMVFRNAKRGLSRCDWAGIVARNMPNGERATQTRDGECGKTMVPLSGSSKNDAQLLCQNVGQNVLRKTGETGDDASRSVTPIGHSTETGGGGLMVLFNACQRFLRRVASRRVSP